MRAIRPQQVVLNVFDLAGPANANGLVIMP